MLIKRAQLFQIEVRLYVSEMGSYTQYTWWSCFDGDQEGPLISNRGEIIRLRNGVVHAVYMKESLRCWSRGPNDFKKRWDDTSQKWVRMRSIHDTVALMPIKSDQWFQIEVIIRLRNGFVYAVFMIKLLWCWSRGSNDFKKRWGDTSQKWVRTRSIHDKVALMLIKSAQWFQIQVRLYVSEMGTYTQYTW